jgi:PAS domain S-box-containing protein
MITMVNEEFERLAGIQAADVELRYFWVDFFPQEDQRALLAMQRNADELQESQHAKLTFNTANGEERFVRILVAKLPRVNVCVISLQDLTEQQQTETALRTIQQELEETVSSRTKELRDAVEELKEMDRLKSAFLSSASHELRTPLTSVLGYTKLIRKTLRRHFWPTGRRKEALAPIVQELESNFKIIEREGKRLTQIIDDLLDLNTIESGSMVWRDEVFDPAEVLDQAVRNIQPALQKREFVKCESTYPRSLGFVRMDRARLHQVVINLLDNAVKFTHQGTVALRASNKEAGWVEIRVEDSGVGIPKEELEAIFDKFYQTQSPDGLSDKPLGTGLGLTICRRIVERYHGRIWVESEPGRGSTFIVRLPMTEKDGKPLRNKSEDVGAA